MLVAARTAHTPERVASELLDGTIVRGFFETDLDALAVSCLVDVQEYTPNPELPLIQRR